MIAGAVAVAVVLAVDAGLSPSVKTVAAPVVAAAAVAAGAVAGAEVAVAAPRGFSIKARPPPAAVVVAEAVLVAEAAPKVKPVPVAVAVAGAAAVAMGAAKRDGPEAGAAWVVAVGAGVDEGLIPKVNPPP